MNKNFMKWTRLFVLAMLLMVSVLQAAAQDESPQSNKEAIHTAFVGLSEGNLVPAVDLYADPFVFNGAEVTKEESISLILSAYLGAFPDLQVTPTTLIAQDEWVAAHVTWSGTFDNTLKLDQEIPPTGETATWTQLLFFRFDAGVITEFWTINDPTIMFSQWGVIPAEESEPTGTVLEEPVGYQLLSDEEFAATFTSGMEERNLELFNEQIGLGLGQFTQHYANPYYANSLIDWTGGVPTSVADIEENDPFADLLETAMPDNTLTADIIVAEGDWIAGLGTFRGTFTEDVDFFGTPLTHTDEEITFQLGVVDRYNVDGKIIEEWGEGDFTPIFAGLGMMPPTEDEE